MAKHIRTPEEEFIATSKYQDLQKACIIRGMPFQTLVEGDHLRLAHFLRKEWYNKKDETLLEKFDKWRHQIMKELGRGDEPFIRLSYVPDNMEEIIKDNIIKTKEKSDKPKRSLDQDLGIMGGTKKHLAYSCQKAGKTIEETLKIVQTQFPDAQPKSVIIWWKRSKKDNS